MPDSLIPVPGNPSPFTYRWPEEGPRIFQSGGYPFAAYPFQLPKFSFHIMAMARPGSGKSFFKAEDLDRLLSDARLTNRQAPVDESE